MGHLLTVPSAPNWHSINTGKWESCQSKEQCRLGCCSVNVKSLRASVPMAQFRFLSLTGKTETDGETELSKPNIKENTQFLVLSLWGYYFKAHCLIAIYWRLKPTQLWHQSGLCAAEGQFVFGLWLQHPGDKDQKPNISRLAAPEGPWELW